MKALQEVNFLYKLYLLYLQYMDKKPPCLFPNSVIYYENDSTYRNSKMD